MRRRWIIDRTEHEESYTAGGGRLGKKKKKIIDKFRGFRERPPAAVVLMSCLINGK